MVLLKLRRYYSNKYIIIRADLASSSVSCVYVFLQRKDQGTYNELFTELTTRAEQMGHYLDPDIIVTGFELAVANTIKIVIGPHVNTKFCFFHLTQNTWTKVQKLGLTVLYRSNDEVRHFIGMLDGTAFLDLGHICSGIDHLKNDLPGGLNTSEEEALTALVTYFDETYVRGTTRRTANGVNRIIPPLFPPGTWNVYQATLNDDDRTNNFCES